MLKMTFIKNLIVMKIKCAGLVLGLLFHTVVTNGYNMKSMENSAFICNEHTSSEGKKNGTIVSPHYPDPYPSSIICQYEFEGVGQERVQLRFLEMNLHYSGRDPTDPYDCSSQDRITVVVFIDDEEEELGTYCGRKTPPQLMSNGVKMKVIFRSEGSQKTSVSGFKLEYNFRTDFGVQSTGEQDTRGVCTFMFHSNITPQGRFTSPNIGGLYPRDTECHYIFDGKPTEKVVIRFLEFDVDGILPRCDETTKSDLVSFSNFLNSEDRKMPQYCGKKPGRPSVQSDGAFFRVIFRSNHIYDAKGFKAVYAFQRTDEHSTVVPPKTVSDNLSSGSSNSIMTGLLMFFYFCQTVIFHML